ncbi:MAG: murein biosynthesis integral membrane protein MurJ [Acidimicrobiales bacterium]
MSASTDSRGDRRDGSDPPDVGGGRGGGRGRGARGIGAAAIVVSVGILLSRLLGWGRQLVIVSLLGLTDESSLYTNAFLIPDYLTFLMAGGYLSITLVPLLSRHLASGDDDELHATFTAVFRIVAVSFTVLAAVSMLLAGEIVALLFPAVEDQARLTYLTRIALASQVFFGMGTLLMAAQYSMKRFVVPSLAPLIYNVAIIAGGAVGWLVGNPSPEAFLWGGLAGAALGNFGVQWFGAHHLGFRLRPGVPWLHDSVREYLVLAFPLMIGVSAVALDEQWPRLFGQYAGIPGAETALTSARQLNMLPVGMIATAAGVAAFPFLAGLAAERRYVDLNRTVVRSARSAIMVGGLAAGVIGGLSQPLASLAFEHGEMTPENAALVGDLLLLYSVSIPFWPAHQVYSRAFYARKMMWLPVIVGSTVTAVLLPVLWAAVHAFGAQGVAGASSFGIALYTVAIAITWNRAGGHRAAASAQPDPADGEPGPDPGPPGQAAGAAMVGFSVRVGVAALATGLVCWGVDRAIGGGQGLANLIPLLVGGPVGLAAYLGLCHLFRIPELGDTVARVRARVPGLRG